MRSLIETNKVQFIDIEQFLPMLIQFVNGATEIAQRTESDAIKSWLSVQSANGLMALSEMKEMLTIVHGISNLDFRYRIMSEISIRLVKKGLIEDAHRIYQEIGEQKIRDATVTLVVHELDGLDPKKAIHGFYTFLYDLINGEFKSVCHSISQVIPLITKLAGPDRGAELVWTAYEQILRVDSFWMQKDLVT